MLAGAGVPILKALQAAAETLNNRAMRADAMDALVLVREGAPLASALAQKKRFPGLLAMFSRLGEQTGQLPLMLQRASTQLAAEVQRRALQLATMLEPLLIVAMGVVVMLIVLAVLLPIIQLNQWVKCCAGRALATGDVSSARPDLRRQAWSRGPQLVLAWGGDALGGMSHECIAGRATRRRHLVTGAV
jgi:hypothetical protein